MNTEDEIGQEIVDAAVKILSAMGRGLLESVHEVVLGQELVMHFNDEDRMCSYLLGLGLDH